MVVLPYSSFAATLQFCVQLNKKKRDACRLTVMYSHFIATNMTCLLRCQHLLTASMQRQNGQETQLAQRNRTTLYIISKCCYA